MSSAPELEFWQAEWCPHSRLVRERLTELGVDFIARQVPAERDRRDALREATGQVSIPALVFGDGTIVIGADDELLAALDRRYPDVESTPGQEQAAKAHGMDATGRTG